MLETLQAKRRAAAAAKPSDPRAELTRYLEEDVELTADEADNILLWWKVSFSTLIGSRTLNGTSAAKSH